MRRKMIALPAALAAKLPPGSEATASRKARSRNCADTRSSQPRSTSDPARHQRSVGVDARDARARGRGVAGSATAHLYLDDRCFGHGDPLWSRPDAEWTSSPPAGKGIRSDPGGDAWA